MRRLPKPIIAAVTGSPPERARIARVRLRHPDRRRHRIAPGLSRVSLIPDTGATWPCRGSGGRRRLSWRSSASHSPQPTRNGSGSWPGSSRRGPPPEAQAPWAWRPGTPSPRADEGALAARRAHSGADRGGGGLSGARPGPTDHARDGVPRAASTAVRDRGAHRGHPTARLRRHASDRRRPQSGPNTYRSRNGFRSRRSGSSSSARATNRARSG